MKNKEISKSLLEIITRECKDAIEMFDVVTPDIYAGIFNAKAREHGIEPDDLEDLAKEQLDEVIEKLITLSRKSSEQISALDSSSQKALEAMHDRNEKLLQESIDETAKLRQEIAKLQEDLYIDTLTQTYNRKWLHAYWLDGSFRFVKSSVLAIVDLNYFKQINDTLGHVAGDKVLRFIANHLKKIGVPVVRYGGDEFLLLFDGEEGEKNEMMAAKKLENNREELIHTTLKFEGRSFKTSYSYGVAYIPENTLFEEALKKADRKLYYDKEAIKKRIRPPFE